jgi:DNA modification methylase
MSEVICGDVLEVLKTLPTESVNCCVTSPPYYGLRDYGTAQWQGGDVNCEHIKSKGMSDKNTLGSTKHLPQTNAANIGLIQQYKDICGKCGAIRIDNQIGLEPTPEEYVSKMVEVFREVRRVLRNDGTLWLNLGDSYAGNGKGQTQNGCADPKVKKCHGMKLPKSDIGRLKPKNLIGIPWMLAFALRADGWYLRQDIIWAKPNPMPESVTDRCTKSHEYIFLMAKSQKYYYDNEAISEPVAESTVSRLGQDIENQKGSDRVPGKTNGTMKAVPPRYGGNKYTQNPEIFNRTKSGNAYDYRPFRNKRDVWTVTTNPFKGAHFAVFPLKLIEPCILAGCPENGIVLDPFGGSGTTACVAKAHNRQYIIIDLNPEYVKMAERRLAGTINQMPLERIARAEVSNNDL